MKFGQGSVTLRAYMEASEAHAHAAAGAAGKPWLTIRVSDTGRGMSDDEARSCFNAYNHTAAASGGGACLMSVCVTLAARTRQC